MAFLSERDRQPERMDQPGLDVVSHQRALDGLRTTNTVSRVSQGIWRALRRAWSPSSNSEPLRILDIAAGGGDVVIGLARLSQRDNVPTEIHGCDINPTAVKHAQRAAANAGVTRSITFSRLNALTDPLPTNYDVVMSTLFLHHLSESDAQSLLHRMADAARRCVIVDDLQRSRLGYCYAWAGARALTRSRIVHTDGPLSVRSAFTIEETRQLADNAGMHGARFQRHWPERFLMLWTKG